jgi:hypothetical protein
MKMNFLQLLQEAGHVMTEKDKCNRCQALGVRHRVKELKT